MDSLSLKENDIKAEQGGKRLVFSTLFSGSSGNCTYIRYGEDEILIDAGKSYGAICKKLASLGSSIDNIKAIFITHEHSDHTAALKVMLKKRSIPVYIHRSCCWEMTDIHDCFRTFQGNFTEKVGDMEIEGFYTPHDSMQSLGYTVKCGNIYIGVATDMGMVAKNVVRSLAGCKAVLIEANYDDVMLKSGPYPPQLKRRVASDRGHLSNDDSALLAAVLANAGTGHIALGHLSLENNMPDIALGRVKKELEQRGLKACVSVADRNETTVIIDEVILDDECKYNMPRNSEGAISS